MEARRAFAQFLLPCMLGNILGVSLPALSLSVEHALAAGTQCSDGIDNDGDGLKDFPQDPACLSASDNSEFLFEPSNTSYLSVDDSPLTSYSRCGDFSLEDFEDGRLNMPFVSKTGGRVISALSNGPGNPANTTDSVDADDGTIDGKGGKGRSWFAYPEGSTTFRFAAGHYPKAAGIVWTDGNTPTKIQFFDAAGNSIGVLSGTHPDKTFVSTTGEDRFYGAKHPSGISAIQIFRTNTNGVEVDHLQACAGSTQPPPPPAQCNDSRDNDGDGLVDFPNDPGCDSPADDDETDECRDGRQTATILAGDKDGFGIGIAIGSSYQDFNKFTPDPNDPTTMDRSLVASSWNLGVESNSFRGPYTIKPVPFTMTIPQAVTSSRIDDAVLRITTGDVDDGSRLKDSGPYNTGLIDVKLFIDGQEILGAFDTTDQYISGKAGLTGVIEIPIDTQLLQAAARDGTLTIFVDEPTRNGKKLPGNESNRSEMFAIDYAELEITYVADDCPVPPECSDNIDNDGDHRIDEQDPACHSDFNPNNGNSYNPNDDDESDDRQCSDGIDNDNDGRVDFPNDPGCDSENDDDEQDPPRNDADLSIHKVAPETIVAGEKVTYTLTVENAGPTTASNISVTDTIPYGLNFLPGESNHACRLVSDEVICDGFSLAPGEAKILYLVFRANRSMDCYSSVKNTASVSASQHDPYLGNNNDEAFSTVACAASSSSQSSSTYSQSSHRSRTRNEKVKKMLFDDIEGSATASTSSGGGTLQTQEEHVQKTTNTSAVSQSSSTASITGTQTASKNTRNTLRNSFQEEW